MEMGCSHSNKAVTLRDTEMFAEWDARGVAQTREYVSWHRAEAKRVKRASSAHKHVHHHSGSLTSHGAPVPAPAPEPASAPAPAPAPEPTPAPAASTAEDDAAALAGSRLFAAEVTGDKKSATAHEVLRAAVDTAAEAGAMLQHNLSDAASAASAGARSLIEEGAAAATPEAVLDAGAKLFASVVSSGGA